MIDLRKSKKLLITAFLCFLTAFCGACNANSNTVELVDFNSYEKQVTLGTLFSLPPAIVMDKNGKDYKVEYLIENPTSTAQINNNQFVIDTLDDYTITCLVTVSKKQVFTRVITLKVKDEKSPTVTFGTIAPAIIGQEYEIPVVVTDDSGLVTSINYSVTYGGNAVTVTDGKFTPTEIGEYTVTVNAVDTQNNIAEQTFLVYARTPIGANEVISFSTPTDVTNIKSYGGETASAEYLSTFAGEDGVIKLTYGNTWPQIQFKPLRQMADYNDYDEIVFKIYFPKDGEYANADGNYIKYMKLGNNTIDDIFPTTVTQNFSLDMYDKWVELVFDAEKFKEFWTDDMPFSLSGTAPRLWGNSTSGGNVTSGCYYIADISVRTALNVTADEITVGSDGVAFVPTVTVSTKDGKTLVENQDYTVTSKVTYDYGTPNGYQPNDDRFIADELGATYTVTYTVTCEGFNYILVKTLIIPRVYGEKEIMSFDSRADLTKITLNGTTSLATWLNDYQGEKGVLKCTYTGAWPSLYFLPNQDMSTYANATKVVFRMYICNDGVNPIKALVLGNATQKDISINLTAEQYNTWIDFEFDIEVFNEYWKTDGTINYYYARFWMYTNTVANATPTESTFYIADISVK